MECHFDNYTPSVQLFLRSDNMTKPEENNVYLVVVLVLCDL